VYRKQLADGSMAIGVFNLGETEETVTLSVENSSCFRDVWAKRDRKEGKSLSFRSDPHTVRVWKVIRKDG
jgi:hypothetical protein